MGICIVFLILIIVWLVLTLRKNSGYINYLESRNDCLSKRVDQLERNRLVNYPDHFCTYFNTVNGIYPDGCIVNIKKFSTNEEAKELQEILNKEEEQP